MAIIAPYPRTLKPMFLPPPAQPGHTKKSYIIDKTTFSDFLKKPEKREREISVTLKRYGINYKEWKLYVSQWA